MKKLNSFIFSLLLFIPSLLSAKVSTPLLEREGQGVSLWVVKVTNPSGVDRKDVPVVVDLKNVLGKKTAGVVSAMVTTPSLIGRAGGESVPSQLDDLDGDLIFDELAFVADIPAHTTQTFQVVCSAVSPQRVYPPRTAAFMKVWDRKYRYPYINSIEYQGRNEPLATYDAIYGHGAQWESELVGFRVYMDHRQSIDIYGKPTPQLVLDKTNFYSTREDMANGLGCDILFAGASVGAGSFRGYVEGQPTYVDSVEARGQRVIASGPVRAIVEVWDKNWWYHGETLQMRQRYTIYAGHRDVQVDIQLRGADIDSEQFCTGVQKIEMDNEGFLDELVPLSHGRGGRGEASALAGSWGKNIPDKAAPDLVEGVGLGVYAPAPYLNAIVEDPLNYLTILRPHDGHIRYHLAICALMEQNGFKDARSWFAWLRQWQAELNQPCTVQIP